MGGVTVKDVEVRARSTPRTPRIRMELTKYSQAQKFINAYAAFLKRQGKLPMYVSRSLNCAEITILTVLQSRFVSTQRVNESLNPVTGGYLHAQLADHLSTGWVDTVKTSRTYHIIANAVVYV